MKKILKYRMTFIKKTIEYFYFQYTTTLRKFYKYHNNQGYKVTIYKVKALRGN